MSEMPLMPPEEPGAPSSETAADGPAAEPAEAQAAAPGAAAEAAATPDLPDGFHGLLEARPQAGPAALAVGQRVRGKILSIGDDTTVVGFTGRPEAVLPTAEIRGPGGALLLRVGDPVSALVTQLGEPITLTIGKKRALVSAARVRLALEEERSVQGTVTGLNKGGFEVRLYGLRSFCPASQMESGTALDPRLHVGQTYAFRVLRWENGGRTIVVSRRAILREQARARAEVVRRTLAVGVELEATVARVQPFGAFVDLGGLEGLLHVSRLGRGRVQDASDVLQPGQALRVRVTRIENAGTRKERIALAAADPGPDPWAGIGEALHEGDVVEGRVLRLADFGVFVQVQPGVDGLVHISEVGPGRQTAESLREAVHPGDSVRVRILRIDATKKRVSLSMRQAADKPAPRPPRRPAHERGPAPTSAGPLTHTMAEQLGALRGKFFRS